MHQSHHLVGCHTAGINYLLISFFKCFTLFKSIASSHNSDMNNSLRNIFIKMKIIKINIIKIYTKNTNHFITKKFEVNLIFKKSYLTKILLVTIQSGANLHTGRKLSTALSPFSWVLCLSRQYFSIKG